MEKCIRMLSILIVCNFIVMIFPLYEQKGPIDFPTEFCSLLYLQSSMVENMHMHKFTYYNFFMSHLRRRVQLLVNDSII